MNLLTPEHIRDVLAQMPEDLKRKVAALGIEFTPQLRKVPEESRAGRDAVYLYASSTFEWGDFIPADATPMEILKFVEAAILGFERRYDKARAKGADDGR